MDEHNIIVLTVVTFEDMVQIYLSQDRVQWFTHINMAMNFKVTLYQDFVWT